MALPSQRHPSRRGLLCTVVLALLPTCWSAAQNIQGIPPTWPLPIDTTTANSAAGMVASDAPLATHAGVEILRAGGNAVDAAVGTAFALAVVLPGAGNIGGGGFAVLRLADGTVASLDFRETAPARASRSMYDGTPVGITRNPSTTGHRAAGVPGSVAGLWELHKTYGVLPWKTVLASAIRLAREGFIVDKRFSASVREDSSRLSLFPPSRDLFIAGGHSLREGEQWKNPDLAETLSRIADRGPDDFYRGTTASLIIAEMERGGGIADREDLLSYRAIWRTPVEFSYRNHRVITMPPPSSGGVTLAMISNILEGYDLHALGWGSSTSLHLKAEAMRRAFADRNAVLGDPNFVTMPIDTLLSKSYAARRRRTISLRRATPSSEVSAGVAEGNHTTHFSVVDKTGNAVALTTTLNWGYGSAVTVSGAGFLLNDEMDDFAARSGMPNAFGLVQGEANAIVPGKRMLSSMTPAIVLDTAGQTMLVTGASGGPRIISAVFQVISNVVDYSMDLCAAVDAPRIHHQHLPDQLVFEEGGISQDAKAGLEAMGHRLVPSPRVGIASSLARWNGRWFGMADPRGDGSAEGE